MPWCPKCKMEYQTGFTTCSDCKVDLVENLEAAIVFTPYIQTEDQKTAEKILRYFEYSDLKSELSYDETNELYVISIDPKTEKQAKKLFQAFYYVEHDNLLNPEIQSQMKKATSKLSDENNASEEVLDELSNHNDNLQEDDSDLATLENDYEPELTGDDIPNIEDEQNQTGAYIMKADQYRDLTGTVWVFLLFGIGGLVFVFLNMIGTLSFFNGWLPNTVLGAMFLFFLYVAITTHQKAKKVRAEIDTENQLTKEINEWLVLNINETFLSSMQNDQLSEELNYIKITDTIKEMLLQKFGTQNLAYLDRLIEEYYSSNIDVEV